jgi:hypothetical protein
MAETELTFKILLHKVNLDWDTLKAPKHGPQTLSFGVKLLALPTFTVACTLP